MQENGGYENGLKEGHWVACYANGNVRSEGDYHEGKKQGLWIQYWPNAQKKSEGTFVNDLFSGLFTCWHENGIIQWHGYYNEHDGTSKSGTKDGVWLCYDPETGEVWRRMHYKRGARTRPDELAPFEIDRKMGDERS